MKNLVFTILLTTACLTRPWRASAQVVMLNERPPAAQFAISHDNDAEGWLRKAREAAAGQDWKLLADTLARVVEQDGLRTVVVEDGSKSSSKRFSTVSVEAWRILSQGGAGALTAFRLTYDAEAARQFEELRETHDVARLRAFLTRYRPTTSGTQAADLRATWLLDEGQWFEALRALDDLEAFPYEPIERWTIELRRATAHAALGQKELAARAIERVRRLPKTEQPADLAERSTELERLLADPALLTTVTAATSWPWLLGDSARAGRMAAVEPSLVGEAAARFELPDGPFINVEAALDACVRLHRAPVWEAVTDGRTLFVGTPTGFAALEPQSLTYRWLPITSAEKARRQTVRPRVNRWMIQQQQGGGGREGALSPRDARPVYDELAGTLAVFGGKVFFIEQPQQSANDYSGLVDSDTQSDLIENSLGAYDAATGKLLWRKGRAGPLEDGLLDAHFFAAPVPAGDRIVSICRLGPDLMLLVISQEGRLIEKLPLGSGPESVFPASRVLPMTVADGDLIVQTGMGVVMCLDVESLSLRWSSSYPRAMGDAMQNIGRVRVVIGEGTALPDGWLRNPPLVRGDRVIVAPVDSNELIAMDRRDGRVLWRSPRGGLRYLVGMDDNQVFATGDRVTAFHVADGSESWSLTGPRLTGRAVLSGSRILAPTMTGLLTLAVGNGEKIASSGGDNAGGSLGNLFVWENALYSLELNAVRRFADISRELAWTKKRLESEPGDDTARLRLAWIYLAKNEWGQTLRVLDEPVRRGPAFGGEGPSPLATEESNHLRVLALLGQSRMTGVKPDDATAILDRAARLAVKPQDVVDVVRAVGANEIDAGRPGRALERALAALWRAGNAAVSMDANYRVRGGVALGGLMRNAWNASSDAERERLETLLNEEVMLACQRGDFAAVQLLADTLGFVPAAARADDWLATSERAANMPESAAFYEKRAIQRRSSSPASRSVKQTSTRPTNNKDTLVLQLERAYDPQGSQNVLGVWTPDQEEKSANDMAVMVTNESLIGVSLNDVTTRWRADLMNVLPDEASNMEGRMAGLRGLRGPPAFSGKAAAIPSFAGLQFVGLETGTMLSRPITPPEALETMMPDVPAAATAGMIVAAIDPQTVVGFPARNGAWPSWRRSLEVSSIGRVAAIDDVAVVVASDWSTAWVMDASNGRLRGRLALEPEPEVELKPDDDQGLLFKHSLLMERFIVLARGRELTACRLPEGGVAWKKRMPRKIMEVRMLDASHLGVSDDEKMSVLALADGRSVAEIRVKEAHLPPVDAVLNATGHVVMLLRTDESPSQVKLEWYELSSGERLVSHGPWPAALVSPRMLRESGELVAVARYDVTRLTQIGPGVQVMVQPMGGRGQVETPVISWKTGMLNLYNKSTGARVARPLEIGGESPLVDVLFRGNRIVVVTQRGWWSYQLAAE